MVVDRDREHLLGVVLADHVVVEDLADLLRGRHAVAGLHERGLVLLADDVHAQLDAFVADEHRRAGDELAHLVLALAAERAVERVLRVVAASLAHDLSPIASANPALPTPLILQVTARRPKKRYPTPRHRAARDRSPLESRCKHAHRRGINSNRGARQNDAPQRESAPASAGGSAAAPAPGRFASTWSTMPNSCAASAVMKLSRSSACSIASIVLAGVLHVDLVEPPLERLDLAGVDQDVGRLALEAAGGLVDHDAGVRQGKAHALLAGRRAAASPSRPPGRRRASRPGSG